MEPRRTFGPVVLLGLGSAAAAALAGNKVWAKPALSPTELGLLPSQTVTGDMPLAGALGLVLLAAWGVLLVTRGRVRTVMAGLLVVIATGLAIATFSAPWTLHDSVVQNYRDLGGAQGSADLDVSLTGWYWVALVAAVLAVVAAVAAVVWCRAWPAMSSRYDAPATQRAAANAHPADQTDLWKALDAGQDPTERPESEAP